MPLLVMRREATLSNLVRSFSLGLRPAVIDQREF